MTEKFTSLLAACAGTLALFAAAAPASAKDTITIVANAERAPVRLVSYRDLNLVQSKDERILVARVRHATREVCVESNAADPFFPTLFVECREQAWHGAKPQIRRAVLRAREIAAYGWSAIAPVAISISIR